MVQTFSEMCADTTYLQLSVLLAGALLFVMVGIRNMFNEHLHGLLYLTIGLFLLLVHFVCFWTIPSDITLFPFSDSASLWTWLVGLAAPSLAGLLLSLGITAIFTARFRQGMIRLFFGLTLCCYLFMIGPNWPLDIRGLLTVLYGGAFFESELRFFGSAGQNRCQPTQCHECP